ncbi:hypothetical protein C8Q79DRAFT_1119835 [Trametes meyenii]|nr:hypothetical protein C8Q79DRAFT_1119835 [Trametes meyenii]
MIFCPLPGTYVVGQIDIEATLEPLKDPDALAAASRIKPKKYLLYLHTPLQLPFPGGGPYKYLVHMVGPDPRPAEPENFVTSDMCIPIYPNTNHPTGRPPIHASPEFPVSKCCHWIGFDLERKVRVVEGVFPEEETTSLPGKGHVRMEICGGEDLQRIYDAKLACEETLRSNVVKGIDRGPEDLAEATTGSASLSWHPNDSTDTFSDQQDTDMFGLEYDASDDMLPVIRVWLDIAGEFAETGAPNPKGFIEESEAIASIMKDSKTRMSEVYREQMAADRALAKFGWAGQHIASGGGMQREGLKDEEKRSLLADHPESV